MSHPEVGTEMTEGAREPRPQRSGQSFAALYVGFQIAGVLYLTKELRAAVLVEDWGVLLLPM